MKILVTRPAAQSGPMVNAITQQGDLAIELPLLSIDVFTEQDTSACIDIRQNVQQLAHYHHVIFISTNAVHAGCDWIDQYWPQLPVLPRWYAIGAATAKAMAVRELPCEDTALAMNSEALLEHPALAALSNQKVLIVRGVGGREHLKAALESRGATVDYLEVYQRKALSYPSGTLQNIQKNGLDVLTMTSGETIQGLLDQAMIEGLSQQMLEIPAVVPGARLEKLAMDHGFKQVYCASNAGLEAMLATIEEVRTNKKL